MFNLLIQTSSMTGTYFKLLNEFSSTYQQAREKKKSFFLLPVQPFQDEIGVQSECFDLSVDPFHSNSRPMLRDCPASTCNYPNGTFLRKTYQYEATDINNPLNDCTMQHHVEIFEVVPDDPAWFFGTGWYHEEAGPKAVETSL